jgi:D-arabinose 5-phosphate isomerase GutQ
LNVQKIIEIFHKTMREIVDQVKNNEDSINDDDFAKLIDLVIKVKDSDNMVFIYGAGRSGFIGRCFAQRLMHL